MTTFAYYIFRFAVWFIGILPFSFLYRLSDFVAWILNSVLGYRRTIIEGNLRRSFPQKSDDEINTIVKGVYQNLGDVLIESIKGFSLSDEEILKRHHCKNIELLNGFYEQGKSVVILTAHYGNWEWGAIAMVHEAKHKAIAFYEPTSNKKVDAYLRNLRENSGIQLYGGHKMPYAFKDNQDETALYVMIADQTPRGLKKVIWVDFMNRKTPCHRAAEQYAKRYDYPVVFAEVERTKRGHYTIEFHLVSDNSRALEDGKITTKYMGALQEVIQKKPEDWLWSHRRWKRVKE